MLLCSCACLTGDQFAASLDIICVFVAVCTMHLLWNFREGEEGGWSSVQPQHETGRNEVMGKLGEIYLAVSVGVLYQGFIVHRPLGDLRFIGLLMHLEERKVFYFAKFSVHRCTCT
jgi:hypothetical protein